METSEAGTDTDTDFAFYKKQGEDSVCAFTHNDCPACPFPLCFYDKKRTAISAARHELMVELHEKRYKPRAVATILNLAPSTVRRKLSGRNSEADEH